MKIVNRKGKKTQNKPEIDMLITNENENLKYV